MSPERIDANQLADELRSAADEFNRLAELASSQGLAVDVTLIGCRRMGGAPWQELQVEISKTL